MPGSKPMRVRARRAELYAALLHHLPERPSFSQMCSLYKLRRSAAEVEHSANAMAQPGLNFAETVYPSYQGFVVVGDQVPPMTWGFPVGAKSMEPTSKPKVVTDARDDKVHTSFWKPSFETRRCLIPETTWAEWPVWKIYRSDSGSGLQTGMECAVGVTIA